MLSKRMFGSDPEFFISKHNTNSEVGYIPFIIPPASLITDLGMKFTLSPNNKRVLLEKSEYRCIEDGAALEINIKKPVDNVSDFYSIIQTALEEVSIVLRRLDYDLSISSSILGFFSIDKFWKNRDKSFHDCVRFGCDPDTFPELYIDSGFESEVCKEIDASNHQYRYAGGHLHVQNMSDDSDIYFKYVELAPIIFDFFVGTTNVSFHRIPEIIKQEKFRLNFYGRPGRIRLQKYSDKVNGIEYRPPSNQWLTNTYHIGAMFTAAEIAANIIENEKAEEFFTVFSSRLHEMWKALTLHDVNIAKQLLYNSLEWAFDNKFTTIYEVNKLHGQL